MSKRFSLLIALLALSAFSLYYVVLKPKPANQLKKALSAIEIGSYSKAEKELEKLSAKKTTYPKTLYQGYLAQARGRYEESDLLFQASLKLIQEKHPHGHAEILLAQAANAYLQNEDRDFFALVDAASSLASTPSILSYFEGLKHYRQNQYSKALQAWNSGSWEEVDEEGSGWMGKILDNLFPYTQRELQLAYCMTETGDILTGREILEKESRRIQPYDTDLYNLSLLFLGHSYLKEAQQIPTTQRGSYYKLSRFYFAHAGTNEPFGREKRSVIQQVQKEAETLLLTDLTEEQKKWGFGFVHLLQDWQADGAIESLSDRLSQKLLKGENLALCSGMREEFLGSSFHEKVSQKLLASVSTRMKAGEILDLIALWPLINNLSDTPKEAAVQIASLTSEEIFRTIKKDGKTLQSTRQFLAFWEALGQSEKEKVQLAEDLLFHAKLLWYNEGHETKGLRLMEVAFNLSDQNTHIHREIETYLTSLYTQAENSHLIGRLSTIYDAMGHFHINKQELASHEKIANHLADAEYLYQSQNYTSAKTHAAWILKLDPDNTQALRLVGLASFQLGEYGTALASLKQLPAPDEFTQKALVLSQAFASQEAEGHLAQIDSENPFE
ncbi:MAG: hypothetical protein K940chlam9_00839 [Chlamydiae bacterium]|nr:hypothetical protein [Chlamydiota bacterium]